MSWDRAPVRLSLRPLGGQGQPYDDDVVALARELVEGTTLTQKEIAARIGVSQMSVGRWARAGRWRRPFGAARPVDERGSSWSALERYEARTAPWRRLDEAERLLDALEREGGGGLEGVERAFASILEARAVMCSIARVA